MSETNSEELYDEPMTAETDEPEVATADEQGDWSSSEDDDTEVDDTQ